eukprot:1235952-Rhodomonas_salina.1
MAQGYGARVRKWDSLRAGHGPSRAPSATARTAPAPPYHTSVPRCAAVVLLVPRAEVHSAVGPCISTNNACLEAVTITHDLILGGYT